MTGPTRESWRAGPEPGAQGGWSALDDDELIAWIEGLAPRHGNDEDLLAIVRSGRHFFVRQEAAKRLEDPGRLKDYFDDRHVGQILARRLSRLEDVAYLESLARKSRFIEVRKAAEAQLKLLRKAIASRASPRAGDELAAAPSMD